MMEHPVPVFYTTSIPIDEGSKQHIRISSVYFRSRQERIPPQASAGKEFSDTVRQVWSTMDNCGGTVLKPQELGLQAMGNKMCQVADAQEGAVL